MTEVDALGADPRDQAVRDEISEFIEENFLYMRLDHVLQPSDDLMALALLDSLGFVELVEEVQDRYGLEVQDVEITEENFGSVNAIVAFVGRKRAR